MKAAKVRGIKFERMLVGDHFEWSPVWGNRVKAFEVLGEVAEILEYGSADAYNQACVYDSEEVMRRLQELPIPEESK